MCLRSHKPAAAPTCHGWLPTRLVLEERGDVIGGVEVVSALEERERERQREREGGREGGREIERAGERERESEREIG